MTLAWYPSGDPTVIGYRVYTREEDSTNVTTSNVLGITQVTLTGLKEGLSYTFTVTAYNAAGLESAPSNEAEFVVPVPIKLLPGATPSAAKRVQFPAVPGHWYEIQSSTNLRTWTTITQVSNVAAYGWTEYQDPASASTTSTPRFYRLQVH